MEIIGPVQTRLQKQQRYGLYALAAVATALQLNPDFENEEIYERLEIRCLNVDDILDRSGTQPLTITAVPFESFGIASNAGTILVSSDPDIEDELDLVVKPQYIKEFKIKVGTLKIEKSFPKVFVD